MVKIVIVATSQLREREKKKSNSNSRVLDYYWNHKMLEKFFFCKRTLNQNVLIYGTERVEGSIWIWLFFIHPCLALFLKLQKIVAIQCFICRFVQFHENEESSFYTFFFFLSFSKHMLSYNISSFGTNSCTISSAYSFGITMKHTMHIIIKQWGSTVIQDNRQRRQNLAEKPKNTQ